MRETAIALFAACLSCIGMASAQTCPSHPADIRVVEQIAPPAFDYSKSDAELTRMKYSEGTTADFANHRIVGLTVASIVATTHVWITSAPAGPDRLCAWPSAVTLTVSTRPTVYVSAAHGHCNLDETKAHEMKHVAIDRSVIDRYMPVFRSEAERAIAEIGTIGPIPRAQLPDIQQEIHDRVREATRRALAALNVDRSVEQRALDTPAEYDRLRQACRPKAKC
jgi:hypothetical protein